MHKRPGYAIATISLKPIGGTPGDATADRWMASPTSPSAIRLAEIRVTHEQNLVLPHVRLDDLPAVFAALAKAGSAPRQCRPDHRHHRLPGPGLLRPGQCPLDPGAQRHRQALRRSRAPAGHRRAEDQDLRLHQCLRPSPCRPYRHTGRRPKGVEIYQIMLGGSGDETCSIGDIVGKGFSSGRRSS